MSNSRDYLSPDGLDRVARQVMTAVGEVQAESSVTTQIANRIYNGVDLSVKHAAEIAGYDSVWTWIKARIQAADWRGINVGDYIPFALTDGKTFKGEVAGIDTYCNYGDTAVKHHIDFITRDCHPDTHVWNKVNYNNGTTVSPNPWLASDLYAWLNSLAMEVPNATTADGTPLTAVDYTTTGVYDKLPAALQNVIIQKRARFPRRYTAGSLLTDDNGADWVNIGKLWLPSEMEVYGTNMWGSLVPATPGYSMGGFQQYPIFSCNMKRIKGANDGGSRADWWLLSAGGGNSAYCTRVSNCGDAAHVIASYAKVRAPLCFRIA